jgi:hypothetical protein
MSQINTQWVQSDQQSELFAKADALGASAFTLSSEIRARTFVETKDRITTAPGILTFRYHSMLDILNSSIC